MAPKLTAFATPRGGSCSGPAEPVPRKALIARDSRVATAD